ncbi:MAG TPA: DUF6807 family protein, partial [Planctomycetia bacterium]|nr:DUF6807 family protein [Planctomycetia bacterium]
MLKRWLFAALAAILAPGASLADTLVVAGGDKPRAAGPVWFAPPEGSAGKSVGLSAEGAVLPAQRDGDRLVFLAPALAAGESKTFKIVLGEGEPAENVSVKEDAAGAAVTVGGKPFFHYNVKDVRKPNVFPLIGPSGASMTQSGPSDHIHHRSLWFTHGKVNGVDFWSESAKAG